MGLISDGIDKVRVYELPAGLWADGGGFAGPGVCLVKWRSAWADKFYHVYVNGLFAGATADCEQRRMVVSVPGSFETAVRIEVFAVEPEDVWVDFGGQDLRADSGRVRISLLRSQNLAFGARFNVYFDGGTGEIDYDRPITERPVDIWACWQDKAGFGLSRFGESDFGRDWSAAVGFGRGVFGSGEFGAGADLIEWVSEPLDAGVYKCAVKVYGRWGGESECAETGEVTVAPAARPAEDLRIVSFDKQTNELVLGVNGAGN